MGSFSSFQWPYWRVVLRVVQRAACTSIALDETELDVKRQAPSPSASRGGRKRRRRPTLTPFPTQKQAAGSAAGPAAGCWPASHSPVGNGTKGRKREPLGHLDKQAQVDGHLLQFGRVGLAAPLTASGRLIIGMMQCQMLRLQQMPHLCTICTGLQPPEGQSSRNAFIADTYVYS